MNPNLVKRLTSQLKAKGVTNPKGMAIARLTQYGELKGGKLTAKGKTRQAMGAAGRAKDRASKASGKPVSAYKYNPKTNQAKLK